MNLEPTLPFANKGVHSVTYQNIIYILPTLFGKLVTYDISKQNGKIETLPLTTPDLDDITNYNMIFRNRNTPCVIIYGGSGSGTTLFIFDLKQKYKAGMLHKVQHTRTLANMK